MLLRLVSQWEHEAIRAFQLNNITVRLDPQRASQEVHSIHRLHGLHLLQILSLQTVQSLGDSLLYLLQELCDKDLLS
jgi:hypothetical protein